MSTYPIQAAVSAARGFTRSSAVARNYRRAWVFGGVWVAASFVLLVPVAFLGAVTSSQVQQILLLLSMCVIVPAALFRGRRRLVAFADRMSEKVYPRPARSEWPSRARAVAIGSWVLPTTIVIALASVCVTAMLATSLDFFGGSTLSETSLSEVMLIVAAPAAPFAILAYPVGRNAFLSELASSAPAVLQRAYQVRDHAQALEDAMHRATLISEEQQRIIEAERELIAELRLDASNNQILSDLSEREVEAVVARLNLSSRKAGKRDIAIALISLVLGYLLTLVPLDAIV